MIIEHIDIERFGALTDVTIDGLRPGVEVLHGTNETGKTSLLEFVRGVFFGFGSLFRRGVLDPNRPCGGRLVARAGVDARRITVERRHDGPHLDRLTAASYATEDNLPLADSLTVLDADESSATALFLRDFTGEIDERTFTAVMAFGLDELHELRTLDADGCGSRLYELASGLDRSKVALVLANLRSAIERLDSTDPDVSPLEALRQRRSAALARLAAMNAPALDAGALALELARIEADLAACEARAAAARAAEEKIRALLPLAPLHAERVRAAAALAELEATPAIHADYDAWELASKNRDHLARLARKKKLTRSRIAKELAGLPVDTVARKKRASIVAVCDERPRLERLMAEVARAESAARQAARRFGEALGAAGLVRLITPERGAGQSVDALAESPLPVGLTHSFGSLKARGRDYKTAIADVRAAERQVAEMRGGLDTTKGSLAAAGSGLGLPIAAAIEEASGRVALYRNRLAAGDQLAELDKALARIDREVAASREAQLLPVGWLIGLGAVFVLGAGMLLSGLLLPAAVTGSLAYALAALGLAGTGLASVATWSLDRAASGRFESARQQHEMVRKQRGEIVAQCAALDPRIDAVRSAAERVPGEVHASLERRATLAQAEVDRLEDLAAREGSLHVLADRVTVAEQALAQALERRAAARSRWKRSLVQRGLPPTLTTADVRAISRHRHALVRLDDERRIASDEARLRREELAAIAARIEGVMIECDMLPEGTPLEHLDQLRERLDRDAAAHVMRGKLERKLIKAREVHRAALRRVKLAERRVQEIVARWGVATEADFLPLVDRRPLIDEARRVSQAAESAWLDARRRVPHAEEFAGWFATGAGASLDTRLAEARAAVVEAGEAAVRAADRRRAAAAQVESAARDRSTEGVQLEIAEIEQDLEGHLHRRRLLEKAAFLLEETRASFARDHQPAVLREASRWLARLTEGRYVSITTSIDEARLEVHDSDGMLWSPDRLSRGTREQVFLALRLALVRDLERHGVHLPVVIDDALVNFDDARALAAARVLVEFVGDEPGERQMLVLTCHAHVARIFTEAGASVRSLSDPTTGWPSRRGLPEREASSPRPPRERKRSRKSERPRVAALSEPAPALTPAVLPEPRDERVAESTWEAEEFFFGRGSRREPRRRRST
jgi:uncharacterized protein YhaN